MMLPLMLCALHATQSVQATATVNATSLISIRLDYSKSECQVYGVLARDGVLTVHTCAASVVNGYPFAGIRKVVIVGPDNEACSFPVERKSEAVRQ